MGSTRDAYGGTSYGAGSYRGKRLFDVVVTAILAVPALFIGCVCAIAVRMSSRGPVFFRQTRVGCRGEQFTLLKFRTMVHDGTPNPFHPDSTRITTVGRLLRRASLDELPQLVNVARGEMSIVGPRPTLQYQVDRYDSRQIGRLAVRPGLTGLAQVTGRNSLPWPERIELDLQYVAQQSVAFDCRLLVRTVGTLVSGSGVEGHPLDDPIARPEGL